MFGDNLDRWFLHVQSFLFALEFRLVQLAFLGLQIYIIYHLAILLYRVFRSLFSPGVLNKNR